MGNVTIYLHKSVVDYADRVATFLNTSRSEIVETMIKHIRDEGLEGDVWEDWDDKEFEEFELTDDTEEEEEEEESEEEEEE